MKRPLPKIEGLSHIPGFLSSSEQRVLCNEVDNAIREAPLFSPKTRWGKPMSVGMTSAGKYGWYSDSRGYRYIDRHPSGVRWPSIPASALRIWNTLVPGSREPDCCLINYYRQNARMGLHTDSDEADFSWPVVSISLGDRALFRVGGKERSDPTASVWLQSGDVVVLGDDARQVYHGIDRTEFGSSELLANGGRFNLTLRVVD